MHLAARPASIVAPLCSLLALAFHGAVYRPPRYGGPGDVPPGAPQPPASGPEPNAPGPRAGLTGGGTSRPPSAPSGPSAPFLRRVTTAAPEVQQEDWQLWWELSREGLLALRSRLVADDARAGSAAGFLGFDPRGGLAPPFLPPGDEEVVRSAVPVLLGCLSEDRSSDLTSAALIALARIGDDLEDTLAQQIEVELRARLGHPEQEVSESAALALGILGRASSAATLAELASDGARARELLRRASAPERTRAFAAYGLGLLAHDTPDAATRVSAAGSLSLVLDGALHAAKPDVPVACLLAYARCGLPPRASDKTASTVSAAPASSREAQVARLRAIFEDPSLDPIVRAHAAIALCWSAADETLADELRLGVVDSLVKRVRGSRGDPALRRGVLLGLGELVGGGAAHVEARARELLLAAAASEPDAAARLFARLSLGRIAARAETSAPDVAGALRAALLHDLEQRGATRRWSALALALEQRLLARTGRQPDALAAAALARVTAGAGSPEDVAALAAACALASPPEAAEPLLALLPRAARDGADAGVLLSLGILGVADSRAQLERALAEATYRPELLRDAAAALGLLGERDVVARLIALLPAASSGIAQAGLSQALGVLGDRSALAPLARLVADQSRPGLARAFAAVALGRVADRDQEAWSLPYSAGVLFTDAPRTLFAREGNGVLNIL